MTPDQIIDLLSFIAARDRRTIGEVDVLAWCDDVGDLSYADAKAAVSRHYRESSDWLTAFTVRRLVKVIREERINAGPIPAPDTDDPAEYIRQLKQYRKDVADRVVPPLAITAGGGDEGWDNPAARRIRAQFDAKQAEARRRRDEEQRAASEAARAYLEAQETLLALDDHGKSATARAREELFGEEQAAAGFPLAAASLGVDEQQKTIIRAAQIAGGGRPITPEETRRTP